MAGSQSPTPGTVSTELRTQLRDGRFDSVTSIRGLPLGVRHALQTLFGSSTLDIADPGGEFDSAVNPTPPTRRLVAAACSTSYCLVYYERAGSPQSRRAVLFHWTPAATRLEWGGGAPASLATIDDVRRAILSGAIRNEATSW